MRKTLGVVGAALLFAVPALAADLGRPAPPVYKAPPPVVPVLSWTGCYIGGNGGGGSAHKENIDNFPSPAQSLGSHAARGGMGGGQVGCDYQVSSWVFGVRGMFDWSDLEGQNTIPQNPAVAYSTKISAIATATGRIGYAITPLWRLAQMGDATSYPAANVVLGD